MKRLYVTALIILAASQVKWWIVLKSPDRCIIINKQRTDHAEAIKESRE
jgi:hypothetical protein